MELNDKEFDATFRKKVFDAEPAFDEAAWDKMERKLRKRERSVFLRNVAVTCLVLIASFLGFYQIGHKDLGNKAVVLNKPSAGQAKERAIADKDDVEGKVNLNIASRSKRNKNLSDSKVEAQDTINNMDSGLRPEPMSQPLEKLAVLPAAPTEDHVLADAGTQGEVSTEPGPPKSNKRAIPMSLSISAGPEFNSASSVIGGSPGFSAGLAFGFGVTNRLSLRTGIQYSMKAYHANNYAYKFASERIQGLVSDVDATCAVLEIPLQVSYRISENYKRSIDVNAGISSYFMLKEDYTFKYTPASGIQDRLVERKNENQHYLSVVDLSATYFIKLKKEGVKLGFEPFVKIPLAGVGEGKVKLKSSGISLRLRYDLDKKNN